MQTSFLIAYLSEPTHWKYIGVISIKNRKMSFSEDYADLPVHHCREIAKAVRFVNADPACKEAELDSGDLHLRVTRLSPNRTRDWCKCGAESFDQFLNDDQCYCKIAKHHWHCKCGGVVQIG